VARPLLLSPDRTVAGLLPLRMKPKAYARAGVDIDLGNQVKATLPQLLAATQQTSSAAEAMRRIAGMSRVVFRSASGQLPMFLEFWSQSAHDPTVWKNTIAPYQRYREYFSLLIETGVAEGSIRKADAATAGPALMALVIGVLLQGLMDPTGADWSSVMEQGVALLVRGMQVEG